MPARYKIDQITGRRDHAVRLALHALRIACGSAWVMARWFARRRALAAWTLTAIAAAPCAFVQPAAAALLPVWLQLRPGQVGLVDAAPWPIASRPEAALTGSELSAEKNPDDYEAPPEDALHAPIGVRVVVAEVASNHVVRVTRAGSDVLSYVRLDHLAPQIPPGTALVVAGGFGNYADFYSTLATPADRAEQLATGTKLLALKMGVGLYDPDGSDFVRVKVLIRSGPSRGRTGWIPVGYTGLAKTAGFTSTAERACRCRIVEFR